MLQTHFEVVSTGQELSEKEFDEFVADFVIGIGHSYLPSFPILHHVDWVR